MTLDSIDADFTALGLGALELVSTPRNRTVTGVLLDLVSKRCETLHTLRLESVVGCEDDSEVCLAGTLPALTSLTLCKVLTCDTHELAVPFFLMPNLARFELADSEFGSYLCQRLSLLPALVALQLHCVDVVSSAGTSPIPQLSNLTRLSLTFMPHTFWLEDRHVREILNMPRLDNLDLSGTGIEHHLCAQLATRRYSVYKPGVCGQRFEQCAHVKAHKYL